MPDSKPVAVPGGRQTMQLTDGEIRATGTNVSGYSLFRVASMLRIDAGAPVGGGRILCSVTAAGRRRNRPELRAACGRPIRAPPKPASTARKCRK